jgi:hypothetical protein
MSYGAEAFPGEAEEFLPLENLEIPLQPARFDPNQHRAFGSVPTLLGNEIEVPPFNRLDNLAWQLTAPSAIKSGLYGRSGGNAVNGLVLSPEQYTAIIRNSDAFKASIQAKTQAANRQTNDVRAQEKELLSVSGALKSKARRHERVLRGLNSEAQNLDTLKQWQRTPGYWRTTEVEMRTRASAAWHDTFYRTLRTLKEHHDLSPEQLVDMSNALAFRLTRGSQTDRMRNWGEMLSGGAEYNRDVTLLFAHSARLIEIDRDRLETKLTAFYEEHGLLPVTK